MAAQLFIGRDQELRALDALLVGGARLLTIVGSPGVGKSRLAAELARRQQAPPPIALTDAVDAASMQRAMVQALNAPDDRDANAVIERRLAAMGDALIVLDGCDRVAEPLAVALEAWIVATSVRFVATSRTHFALEQEHTYELGPLPEGAAVALLKERIRRAGARHGLDDEQRLLLIAQQLDGVPLAIELAAARFTLLSPLQLLDRLRSSRDGTLRGAIDLSWQQLSEPERSALAQCSVFAGGFTVEVAEQLVDLGDASCLDALQALREHSLLYSQPAKDGTLRLGMYRSIRDYAAAALAADGALDSVRDRHARCYAELATRWRAQPQSARARLFAEQDNMLLAFEHMVDRDDARDFETAIRSLLGVDMVLMAVGPVDLRLTLLQRALKAIAAREALAPELHARVLQAQGHALRRLGTHAAGRESADQALALAESAGLVALKGELLVDRGIHLNLDGDRSAAADHMREGAETLHRMGDAAGESFARVQLAYVLIELRRADEALEQTRVAQAASRSAADRRGEAIAAYCAGLVHQDQGDLPAAAGNYKRALASFEALDELSYLSSCWCQLGIVHQERGRLDEAEHALSQACERGALDAWSHALALSHLGGVAAQRGDVERARELLTRADVYLAICDVPHLELACGLQRSLIDPAPALVAEARASEATMDVRVSLRIVDAALRRESAGGSLVVQQEGLWFRLPSGELVSCRRRKGPTRRLLAALAERRLSAPGEPVAAKELLGICWPDERMLEDAGLNRLYVTINGLRKMGLRELLLAVPDGYLLDPEVPARLTAERVPS